MLDTAETGWKRYQINEFYELTTSACGMDQR
jgi:hypothetical protein